MRSATLPLGSRLPYSGFCRKKHYQNRRQQAHTIDVQVICATNKNLWEEVEISNFRADLYYRLNVISIQIPPLRSRIKDIPCYLITSWMLSAQKPAASSSMTGESLMKPLQRYHWPGNVRGLQNVVERMVNISGGSYLNVEAFAPEIRKMNITGNAFSRPAKTETIFEARQQSKKLRAEREKQNIHSLAGQI